MPTGRGPASPITRAAPERPPAACGTPVPDGNDLAGCRRRADLCLAGGDAVAFFYDAARIQRHTAAPLAGSGIEPGGGGATQPPSGSAASGPR